MANARRGTVYPAKVIWCLAAAAGKTILCTRLSAKCVQKTRRHYTYLKQPAIYTPGEENTSRIMRMRKLSLSCTNTSRESHHGKPSNFHECLTRQIVEGVAIRRCDGQVLNTKAEWHQPAIWRVRSELSQE